MISELFEELFPPGIPRLARWRITIFGAISFIMFHIAWACGLLAQFGLVGFAKASDLTDRVAVVSSRVDAMSASLIEVRVSLIEQSIFDAKESECTTAAGPSRRFFQQRVLSLAREYHQLSGTIADIPPCRGSSGLNDGD